jgi:hypothetical protein
VEVSRQAATHFISADGVRRYLPLGWWIFELTTFGDKHVVAELCGKCATKFAGYVQRASKRLGARIRDVRDVPRVLQETAKQLKGKPLSKPKKTKKPKKTTPKKPR